MRKINFISRQHHKYVYVPFCQKDRVRGGAILLLPVSALAELSFCQQGRNHFGKNGSNSPEDHVFSQNLQLSGMSRAGVVENVIYC